MLNIIKDLYKMNRCLLGEGYDNALEYLKHLLKLEIIEIPSGTKLWTWTVPQEWVVKDAWVKFGKKKVISYKENPLSLAINSKPFKGKVSAKELRKHLYIPEFKGVEISDCPTCEAGEKCDKVIPYAYLYYRDDWGFCVPREEVEKYNGKKYEVFIDTEFKKGTLKLGVHTIKGGDREILLFAHLDHPFQANDNLSGVAVLVDLAHKLKKIKPQHTIKIIFCPETIGSIAYAKTQDTSKVDYVIALDIVGNDNTILFQKSFDKSDKINLITHLALHDRGISYRKGEFRFLIGSDEYVFNDPKIGIPGIMLSRFPYNEYHTSADTPKIIKKDKLEEVRDLAIDVIRISEQNYIPELKFKAPLFRQKFDVQTFSQTFNRNLDYFIYLIDGKRDLVEICMMSGVGFEYGYELLKKLQDENLCNNISERGKQEAAK